MTQITRESIRDIERRARVSPQGDAERDARFRLFERFLKCRGVFIAGRPFAAQHAEPGARVAERSGYPDVVAGLRGVFHQPHGLGRVIRDVGRKTAGRPDLREAFARPLALARQIREQQRRQRGRKVYSLHAPEVECIGKGKAHRPYEFGVKVSVATPLRRCKGGQFVAHVAALPGNPYDGHTLATVIPAIRTQLGVSLTRVFADAGYRGHNAPREPGLRVYTAGQKRGVTDQIKREMRRRSAIEPVIGHLKSDHRMDRNHLAGRAGDAANAVLAAVGYNFRLLLAWLVAFLRLVLGRSCGALDLLGSARLLSNAA